MNGDGDVGSLVAERARWLYAWGGANVAIGVSSLLVPLYVVQLGGGPVELGVLWFAISVAMVPGALGVGALLDRTGRHRTLALAALSGAILSLAAVPLSDSIAAIVIADAALWLFVAGVTPVFTMLVIGDAPEDRWNRQVAHLSRYQGFGWAGGLILGAVWTRAFEGLLSPVEVQRSLLAFSVALLAGCTLAATRWLPEETTRMDDPPPSVRMDDPSPSGERGAFTVRGVLTPLLSGRLVSLARWPDPRAVLGRNRGPLGAYLFAVTLFFAGFAVFGAPLPDFLTGAGFDDDIIFLLYVVSSLATAMLYEGAGLLADQYDLRLLQSGALGLRGAVFPAVAATGYGLSTASFTGLLAVAALFAVVGGSYALVVVTANSLVARYAQPGRRGSALGLYTALSAGAGGVGGLLGGWLATTIDYVATFAVAALLVFLGSVLVFGLDRFVPAAD